MPQNNDISKRSFRLSGSPRWTQLVVQCHGTESARIEPEMLAYYSEIYEVDQVSGDEGSWFPVVGLKKNQKFQMSSIKARLMNDC